ncbi:hypothetical protein PM082_010748 [Marasmius tenuissimus]|nr:hypothetical protein PM082_010748 [Marasmius tenuissimus]
MVSKNRKPSMVPMIPTLDYQPPQAPVTTRCAGYIHTHEILVLAFLIIRTANHEY